MSGFEQAALLVMKHEGGYANDPRDPGGETNWGISKRSYPTLDIRALTREQALDIYRRDFWEPLKCDEMPYGLAVQVFDHGFNAGRSSGARLLQRTLGLTEDGVLGPITLAAAKASGKLAIKGYARRRIDFYQSLDGYKTFGASWLDRTLDTLLEAVAV
jgi:lysozyme family protein